MEITEYGKDRLPAGPGLDEAEEVIVVEGRADVLNLLKNGFKNVIAMNGTSVPQAIIDMSKKKELMAFVDGDRGGNLIIKDLLNVSEIDFVTRAPDGKEVEELTKKEIHKALRSRITAEQAKLELAQVDTSNAIRKPVIMRPVPAQRPPQPQQSRPLPPKPVAKLLSGDEKARFSDMLESLIGTRGAYVLDEKLNVLGKVPSTELTSTLKSMNAGVYAVVFDGVVEKDLLDVANGSSVKHIVAMDTRVRPTDGRVNIVTAAEL
jgi:DNA primase